MASGKQPEQHGAAGSSTFFDRIKASASGLTRSAIAQPSAAIETLASLPSGDSKGESSSVSSNAGESTSQRSSSQGLQSSDNEYNAKGPDSFRSEQHTYAGCGQNAQSEFDEFMSPSGGIPTEGGAETGPHNIGIQKTQGPCNDENLRDRPDPKERDQRLQQHSVDAYACKDNDGAAVVALLSDPKFFADEEPGNYWDALEDDQCQLSSEFQSGDRTKTGQDALQTSLIDLIPDLTEFDEHFEPSDVSAWHDIINKYHDEVWGDALPLVQEARQEFKEVAISNDMNLESCPALRRLGMLLQHIRRPNVG